jgi:hypothetical protein
VIFSSYFYSSFYCNVLMFRWYSFAEFSLEYGTRSPRLPMETKVFGFRAGNLLCLILLVLEEGIVLSNLSIIKVVSVSVSKL